MCWTEYLAQPKNRSIELRIPTHFLPRISPEIGFDLQSLSVIGSPIAWLFGQSFQSAENGFSVTGGRFNYSAEISFAASRHTASVSLRFLGVDAFNYLKMEGTVRGTLPPINPKDAELDVQDYTEEFTKIRAGVITSRSTRTFGLQVRHRSCCFDLKFGF